MLSEFLNQEAIKISKTIVNVNYSRSDNTQNYFYKRKTSDFNPNRLQTVLVQNNPCNNEEKCRFCRGGKHGLPDCKKFKRALRKDRWSYVKRNGICFKCLISRHNKDTCPASACDKDNCGQAHHKLLHYNNSGPQSTNNVSITEISDAEPRVESVTTVNNNDCKVLLQTVPICIHGPNGVINSVALLDGGSTVSMICASLSSRLGLSGQKETMHVCGAWNATELKCESYVVNLSLSNKHNGTIYNIKARSVS